VSVPAPPTGLKRITALGPGFLWMVSAAGSGELLFTPRVGSMYGYALLWAMLAAVILKWIINREIGRYAVCSGRSLLAGFSQLRGGRWAVWGILVPQLLVAVAAIAGMAGSAATALILVLPWDLRAWMLVALGASTALVFFGAYSTIERVATFIGVALAVSAVAAAAAAGPSIPELTAGLVPSFPDDTDFGEVLPWLGFMLSGAAGLIWYSYWVPAKGYGVGASHDARVELTGEDEDRLRGWLRQMTFDNSVAVVGTVLVAGAFLVLGAELLRPNGLVPEERRVASTLGRLLGDVFGPVGFWFMIAAVFIGFWDTVLSDQDGHARMFTEGSALVLPRARHLSEQARRRVLIVVLLAAAPAALYFAIGEPVTLLKAAGAIEAAHIPVVAVLTLRLNRRLTPAALRPSRVSVAATYIAAAFFAAFAAYYLISL
jgi:Mn2+/Fe2+ NRAMP family transporter